MQHRPQKAASSLCIFFCCTLFACPSLGQTLGSPAATPGTTSAPALGPTAQPAQPDAPLTVLGPLISAPAQSPSASAPSLLPATTPAGLLSGSITPSVTAPIPSSSNTPGSGPAASFPTAPAPGTLPQPQDAVDVVPLAPIPSSSKLLATAPSSESSADVPPPIDNISDALVPPLAPLQTAMSNDQAAIGAKSGGNGGKIAGGVIGALIGLAAVGAGIALLLRQRRNGKWPFQVGYKKYEGNEDGSRLNV